MSEQNPQREEKGLLYNDDAHRDAWAGLVHLGIWDFEITPDMIGKSFGGAIDAVLSAPDVPHEEIGSGQTWLESLRLTDTQLAQVKESWKITTPVKLLRPGNAEAPLQV
ncbi:hypothetical protein V0M98_33605 (plasmid) [Pseudomonas silesiensis]|uniref:hypothetical protein n=1 Tax=Pseudomonas silesiensis TaxID=1853130 RepID=UPI0030D2D0B6